MNNKSENKMGTYITIAVTSGTTTGTIVGLSDNNPWFIAYPIGAAVGLLLGVATHFLWIRYYAKKSSEKS